MDNFYNEYFAEVNNKNLLDKVRGVAKNIPREGFKKALTKERHIDAKVNPNDFHYFSGVEEPVYDTLTYGLIGNMNMDENDPKRFVKRTYNTKMVGGLVDKFLRKVSGQTNKSANESVMNEAPWDSLATKQKKAQATANKYGSQEAAAKTIHDKEGGEVSSVKVFVIMPKGKVYMLAMVDDHGNDTFYTAANSDAMKSIEKITKRSFKDIVENNAGSFGKEFSGSHGKGTKQYVSAKVSDTTKLLDDTNISKNIGLAINYQQFVKDVEDTRYGVGKQYGTQTLGFIYVFKSKHPGIIITNTPEWFTRIVSKGDKNAYVLNKNGQIITQRDEFQPAMSSTPASTPAAAPAGAAGAAPTTSAASPTPATAPTPSAVPAAGATQPTPAAAGAAPTTSAAPTPAGAAPTTSAAAAGGPAEIAKDDLKLSPIIFTTTEGGKAYMLVSPAHIRANKSADSVDANGKKIKGGPLDMSNLQGVIPSISVKGLGVQRMAIPISSVAATKVFSLDVSDNEMAMRTLGTKGSIFNDPTILQLIDSVTGDYVLVNGKFNERDVTAYVPNTEMENESFIAFKERMLS